MGNPKQKIASKNGAPGLPVSNHFLASGEHARQSGVYRIEHDGDQIHEIKKELFIPSGTKLPFCRQCSNSLKFQLIERIDYIAEDRDFQ